MRLRFLVLVLALGLVPQAAAGPLGNLDSGAPVSLFGAAFAGSPDLVLFHKAFDTATFSGILYNGNIVDRERHYDACSPASPPREQTRTLATASSASPDPIYFEVDARALVLVEFGAEDRTSAGSGEATTADEEDGAPAAYLGPNPYLVNAVDSGAGSSPNARDAVRAFPDEQFLVVPQGSLEFPFEGVALIPFGNLSIVQGGKTATYNSDPTSETSSCSPTPVLPSGLESPVYHTFRIQADNAVLKIRQDGLDRFLAFYGDEPRGPTPTSNDYERVCPTSDDGGYWYQPTGDLQRFYENCDLPATSFTGPELHADVDGVARFDDARGTVATAADDKTVDGETIDLAGNLELVPMSVEDEGRRMTTSLDGAVFSVDSPQAPGGPGADWQAYAAGAAGGALLLGVLVYSWPILKWRFALLGAPLYARLKKDEILENPLRDDILSLVQETPGISASELGRRVECGWGTLVYHLTVLERMQLVSSAREGRHKRFFAQGRINYSDKGAVGLLANPAARTILDAIRDMPGAIQKDLSERLNLSPGTVAWHVDRLAAEGLVIKEDEGRTVRYYPSERLLQLTRSLAA